MALAIATIPGKVGEGVAQLLDAVLVELNSTAPAGVTADLTALIGPAARVDGVSVYNGGTDLVRVTAQTSTGVPIGQANGADGVQVVLPGHTIQFGIEEANVIARLVFEVIALPASNPAGQVVAVGGLAPIPASGANQFMYVNVIEQ